MKPNPKLLRSCALACLIALLVCFPSAAPYAQAQEKNGNSAQLMAQASQQPATAQSPTNPTHTEAVPRPAPVSPADLEAWAKTIHHTHAPKVGCFHVTYPSTQWQEVQCAPPNGWRSGLPKNRKKVNGHEETPGLIPPNNDIVVQSPAGQLFSSVVGSFPTVNGVSSESDAAGIDPGANEYSLQLNTNDNYSAACGSFKDCVPWVQFVMATNTPVSLAGCTESSCPLTNETQVFIEYWLLNYGTDTGNGANICPSGFIDNGPDQLGGAGDDCIQNSPANTIQSGQLPITDLGDLKLSGSATAGGNDEATVTYNGQGYNATVLDSLTDIASVWNQAEFNVLGNAGSSQAVFNNGSWMIAKLEVTDGSMSAPACVDNGGTTGETNNLNFIESGGVPVCCPYGGSDPNIEFMQANPTTGHSASCGSGYINGEPHVTTVNGTYYNFQADGEFIALLDSDGTEVQTRQTALPTVAPGNYDPGNLDNDGLVSCLAMNTAVAARVGSHRVTYEPSFSGKYGSGPFELRIDGKITTPDAKGLNLSGGGLVKDSAAGSGIEVDFPDGKILTAIPSSGYDSMSLLNVQLESVGFQADTSGIGLMGIAGDVPKGSWLPALPNGASVGPMPATLDQRYKTLYDTFGNAWRVTSKNTLFDYASGTSTTTFTNTKWPVENATTCTIPNQTPIKPVSVAVAEEACKAVTDDQLHASCLFDVQATGNAGVADTYKATETVHTILNVKPIDAKLLVTAAK
jgi:hypothetical protein